MITKHVLGGILLVAGTSIGAGMLALPVVTAAGGFFPALFIYLLCWFFMTCTGLLLLELCLEMPPGANLVSIAECYLGFKGKIVAWALYLFLFYCLSVAYISGGGGLLLGWLNLSLPAWAGNFLFTLLLAPFVYRGAKMVDQLNHFLMAGLILSFLVFVALCLPEVQLEPLSRSNWKASLIALPVVFTSFSYQGIIPSLTHYLKRDAKSIRLAIIGGTTVAFLIYLLWEILILGVLPFEGESGLAKAKELGLTAVAPLKDALHSPLIPFWGQVFAFFAITTSFLGVTLGLIDFLADGLKKTKKGWPHVQLALLTFGPPLAIAVIYPSLFLTALNFAGGIGCALLLGLLPTLMVWIARYRSKSPFTAPEQLSGGKKVLAFLFLFVLFEVALELWMEFL
jgi:tyrosine-specific transport protein